MNFAKKAPQNPPAPQITVLGTERLIAVRPNRPALLATDELTAVGRPDPNQVQILLSAATLASLVSHTTSDLTRELGGFLVGRPYLWEGQTYVEIVAAIHGEETVSSAVHLTISPSTWTKAQTRIRAEFPDLHIVGWYHTHPRMSVFFSPMDTAIHEGFFREPWHVALVVEPVKHEAGFFVWVNQRIVRAGGYYVHCPAGQSPPRLWQAPHRLATNGDAQLPTLATFYTPGYWHSRWREADEIAVKVKGGALQAIRAQITAPPTDVIIGFCLGQIQANFSDRQPQLFVAVDDVHPLVLDKMGPDTEKTIKQNIKELVQKGEAARIVGFYMLRTGLEPTVEECFQLLPRLIVSEFSQVILVGDMQQGIQFCCWQQDNKQLIQRPLVEMFALSEVVGEGLQQLLAAVGAVIGVAKGS